MAEEIPSIIDKDQIQTDKQSNFSDTAQNDNTLQTSDTETNDKIPISSTNIFKDLHGNKSENHPDFLKQNFENTKPAEGYNETECIKFAEKLYKVFFMYSLD